ncbi:uncharacterized protein [Panulirus ornatus]|uniref:uncharacterized protein n=1 Tax=Panulirus ornatus TaxID=150431 RepID=UPI003A85898F
MKVAAVVTVGLLAVAAVTVTGDQDDFQKDVKADLPPTEAEERLQSARREERVFAFYTTTSVKRLSTTTITALSTCLSITNPAPACTGRRKRAFFNSLSFPNLPETVPDQLLGSQADAEELEVPSSRIVREVVNNREGKRITIWSTVSSTLTLTSTSYVAGTTVTATALCLAPGLTAGCFGK